MLSFFKLRSWVKKSLHCFTKHWFRFLTCLSIHLRLLWCQECVLSAEKAVSCRVAVTCNPICSGLNKYISRKGYLMNEIDSQVKNNDLFSQERGNLSNKLTALLPQMLFIYLETSLITKFVRKFTCAAFSRPCFPSLWLGLFKELRWFARIRWYRISIRSQPPVKEINRFNRG